MVGSAKKKRRVLLALSMLLGLLVAAPAAAEDPGSGDDLSSAIAQDLDWQPCHHDVTAQTGAIFECARVLVPLDYDKVEVDRFTGDDEDPEDEDDVIGIALVRIPAADQANREGAILLNPGGPGGSGIGFVLGFGPFAGFVLGPEVPARFDLVGFDPRGIAQSTPVRCFDTIDEAVSVFPPLAFPLTRAEEKLFRQSDRALARACRKYDGAREMAEHMSTANVARDMDVIRASMGDESLNFLGLSYGTFVAANYVNLFPHRVRSVVADGVLDPVAWVNKGGAIPFSTRLRSDAGAAATLDEFFAQCEAAAPGNCAFAPNSEQRYADLAARLRDGGPIMLPDPETGQPIPFTYQDLIGFSLGNLYNAFGFADMAGALAFFEAFAFGPPAAPPSPSPAVLAWMAEEPYDNFVEGFPAVACADTDNPRSHRTYSRAAADAEARYGYFGPLWTWASSPCTRWPFKDRDRYEGPFTANTANPVLVIGNLYDPATRYEGAQALRSLLPNSALLTVDVPGHTSLGLSSCAGFLTGQYLLDPASAGGIDGSTCPQEFNAFDLVAGPGPAVAAQAERSTQAAAAPADLDTMIEARASVLAEIGLTPPAIGGAGG